MLRVSLLLCKKCTQAFPIVGKEYAIDPRSFSLGIHFMSIGPKEEVQITRNTLSIIPANVATSKLYPNTTKRAPMTHRGGPLGLSLMPAPDASHCLH